jgi:hypothetical protein
VPWNGTPSKLPLPNAEHARSGPGKVWAANRGIVAVVVALATAAIGVQASAQSIICCNQNIAVGGDWIGSGRIADCQGYFNSAPMPVLRQLCRQRAALTCLNTDRCTELPPDAAASGEPVGGSVALPPQDPDRDGIAQGFGEPPGRGPGPTPDQSAPRLVYLVKVVPSGGPPIAAFTVWLDKAGCPMPIADGNRPADPSAARHVVRGRMVRDGDRVRIDAEAQALGAGAKFGPVTGEAGGTGSAAVAAATRAAAKSLNLACSR